MKRRDLVSLLSFALLVVFAFLGSSYGLTPRPLIVEPSFIDFGEVKMGDRASADIYITNRGDIPVRVHIVPSSPFIEVSKISFTLRPRERTSVRVGFRVSSFSYGPKSGNIIVSTDREEFRVAWRARVVPPHGGGTPPFPPPGSDQGVSETYIELSDFSSGELSREIRLFNPFPYPITVRASSEAPWIRLSTYSVVIPPFGSVPFPIYFYIEDFPSDLLEGFITFYFPWGAVNVRVVARRPVGWYYPGGVISVAPRHINFGRVLHGEVKEETFHVRNNTPGHIRVSVMDTAPWIRVYPYEAFIPPYSSRSFRVRINGSLIPPGFRQAYIWITTPHGRLNITVSARGGF